MKRILKGKRIPFFFIAGIMVCGVCGCSLSGGDTTQRNVEQSVDTAMGTIIQQTVYLEEENHSVTDDILKCIQMLEQKQLSWRLEGTEIYAINESAGNAEGEQLSDEMEYILRQCLEVSKQSKGAFDITMGRVVQLWDIDSWSGQENMDDYVLPKNEEIQEALMQTGYESIRLEGDMLYLPSHLQIDLGAVGKGIALTNVLDFLEERTEVEGAVISVGGSIVTYGSKPDDTPWRVAVVDPIQTGESIGYLTLTGQWCVSTSGDYERYVEIDGVRYHHILDPNTGYPVDSGLSSVTILTKDGLLSDALSTACFVLGEEKGRRLAEQFDAQALFVDKKGNITMTEGMEEYFHLSK